MQALKTLAIALTVAMTIFGITVLASASDIVIDKKITSITAAKTKTGSTYYRIIVPEERILNGVTYNVGVAVSVFDESLFAQVKVLKAGGRLNGIATESEYNGRTSYVLHALIN